MSTNMKTKQLELLLNDFELLSKTVLLQLQIVTKLMDGEKVETLINEAEANEIIIDRLEIKVREEVVFTIFQFTPKAADLRKIITYQDITTNLERVGDMLLNIVHNLEELDFTNKNFGDMRKLMSKMLHNVSEMLRRSVFSFSNEDNVIAYEVLKDDDEVDALFRQIKVSLQNVFESRQLNKSDIRDILNIETISHNLERIGDSATNIAESTIYMTEGKDIRHGNKE